MSFYPICKITHYYSERKNREAAADHIIAESFFGDIDTFGDMGQK
jgi:hypothetical protein